MCIRYMICKYMLELGILNEPELSFIFSQFNGLIYFYLIQIILFTINHLYAHI